MKITTLEQLEALPVGAVVLSHEYPVDNLNDQPTAAFQKRGDCNWYRGARSSWTHPTNFLPATLMIPTTITQEQFDHAAKAVRESEWFGTGYEQAYAALAAIGISVEGENGAS